ncbi:MAG: alpha/beta hydrolase [Propionibacteriaceae bacterium]|nr:alpha/beta hydrolase [Propionibacteriaceae bacterium]
MVATLIRKTPSGQHRRALLYLHGWNDYFFQNHLAMSMAALGYDFYAVDLRRYGRSLRRGQLAGFITDLDDYGDELEAAADLIGEDHDQLLLMGHSTGGLVAALWAASNPDRVSGLVLNSPWLDLQGSAMIRALSGPVIDRLGTNLPTSVLRLPDPGLYARSLHTSLGGEWDYDLELKTTPSPPIRVGWLRAILLGHQRVAAGLQLDPPVLVMCSTATGFARRWHDGLRNVDTVLDVEQIANRAARLGWHVTIVRIDQGLHDLVLSASPVRKRVLDEIGRWAGAYVK